MRSVMELAPYTRPPPQDIWMNRNTLTAALLALNLLPASAMAQAYTFDPTCAPKSSYPAGINAPNVLTILDKSGSMDNSAGNGMSKWDTARLVVKELADSTSKTGVCTMADRSGCDDIRLGLGFFCGSSTLDIEPTEDSRTNIYTRLGATDTCGGTNMGAGTKPFEDSNALKDTSRSAIGIFITDGAPAPADSLPPGIDNLCDARMRASSPVTTYVIGFGSGANPHVNAMMAAAGGSGECKRSDGSVINVCGLSDGQIYDLRAKSGSGFGGATCTGALQADNAQTLKDGVLAIAANAACTFPLDIPAGYPAGAGADEDPFATQVLMNHHIFGSGIEVQPYLAAQPNIFYDYLINARGVAPAVADPFKGEGWVFADQTRRNVRLTSKLCNEIVAGKVDIVDTQVACLCQFTGEPCQVDCPMGVSNVGCEGGKVVGRCGSGVYACVAGRDVCQNVHPRMPELCNGLDDNCDGMIDNMKSAEDDWNPANQPLSSAEEGMFCAFQNVCTCAGSAPDSLGPIPGPMDNAWTLYKASWTGNCRCAEGVEGEDPGVAFDAADDGSSEPAACAVTTPARDATGAISLMLSLGLLAAFTGRRRRS
jgi:hypothetical protein